MQSAPLTRDRLSQMLDLTLTSLGDGEILVSASGIWINQTLAEAGIAAVGDVVKKDGTVALTGNWSAGGNKITSLGTPTSSGDAAPKGYVDALLQGIDLKASVRLATTASGTLASDFENGDTVDGVTLATGNRILLKNQSTASENGIYVVAASGAPARAGDFAAAATVAGAYCFVEEGTANADKGFVCTSNAGADVVGTNNLAFTQFNGAGSISVLDDLSDAIITTPSSGHFLRYNGSNWINVGLVAADLPAMVGDSGSGGTKGAVPAPGTGDYAALKYLDAGGNWSVPPGGSGSSHWHDPVECITTANVSLSGGGIANGTTHDGITVSTGNRILVANQSSPAENGIYVVPASGAASRASDMAAAYNASGDVVAIKRGTIYADYWAMVTSNSSVVGTDPLTIAPLNNGASVVAENLINGGPASGSAAAPTYRSLVPADIPAGVQSEHTNKLINTMFRTWGHSNSAPVTITDGAYSGPTGWFFLTSGSSVEIGYGSGLGHSSFSVIITNQNASSRRAGVSQFVEYYDTLALRGKTVRFSVKAKCSNAKNVRAALINWTGTANAPTKDVVDTWTSTTYTEGNFFISSGSLDIIAVSDAVSVGTSEVEIAVSGTVGASANNLQVFVWTEDALAEDQTIEVSEAMLVKGSYAVEFDAQYYPQENIDCDYRCRMIKSNASQTDVLLGNGWAVSTTIAIVQVPLGHGMRTVPSISFTAADWQLADSVNARVDVSNLSISTTVSSSAHCLFLLATVASGLTTYRSYSLLADTTSGRVLILDAEIGV